MVVAMAELQGLMYPRTPTGAGSVLPSPPWHYSGEMLTIEFRTDPARVAELLPDGLTLADDDPGAVAIIWADWQSCSKNFDELLDPAPGTVGFKSDFYPDKVGGSRSDLPTSIWLADPRIIHK